MIPIVDIKILIALILLSPYLYTCSVLFQGVDPSPQRQQEIQEKL